MKTDILPKVIYFEEKTGSNGIHCLDYKNESDTSYIRSDVSILSSNTNAIEFLKWVIKEDALNWTQHLVDDENNEDDFTPEELYSEFLKHTGA